MTIKKIEDPHDSESELWANLEMDEKRKEECLCLNCDRKNDDPPYSSCPVAGEFYRICVENNMASMITRCGAKDEEENLMYKPIQ